jgi:hypothetical protein
MSRIDFWDWKISVGRHFQNGHHNTAQIQHCPISTTFHMWVDYDVTNSFLTLNNFYRSPFSKWSSQYRINSTLSDFNDISYMGRLWCLEFIPDVEKFLPVAMPFSKWPPQYCTNSTLFDFNVLNWFPTSKNFYRSPFSKWPPQYRKIQHCSISKVAFNLFLNRLSVSGLGDFIIVRF